MCQPDITLKIVHRAARWEKKKEEIGGDCHRDLCPSEGIGARGTGDLAGPAASAATAEAESARGRAAGAPRANLPSHLTAVNVYPWTHDEVFDGTGIFT